MFRCLYRYAFLEPPTLGEESPGVKSCRGKIVTAGTHSKAPTNSKGDRDPGGAGHPRVPHQLLPGAAWPALSLPCSMGWKRRGAAEGSQAQCSFPIKTIRNSFVGANPRNSALHLTFVFEFSWVHFNPQLGAEVAGCRLRTAPRNPAKGGSSSSLKNNCKN